jgi:hypothetical protein
VKVYPHCPQFFDIVKDHRIVRTELDNHPATFDSFEVPFSEEEREIIDALELPRPDGL